MRRRAAQPGNRADRAGGFTLIELMIVVAIVALLVTIAVPTYTQYTTDTRREDGREVLLRVAQLLERCYTTHGSYNDSDCSVIDGSGNLDGPIDSADEYYRITSGASTINADSFTLAAVPQGGHSGDDCGNLTLAETGAKGAAGSLSVDECW